MGNIETTRKVLRKLTYVEAVGSLMGTMEIVKVTLTDIGEGSAQYVFEKKETTSTRNYSEAPGCPFERHVTTTTEEVIVFQTYINALECFANFELPITDKDSSRFRWTLDTHHKLVSP